MRSALKFTNSSPASVPLLSWRHLGDPRAEDTPLAGSGTRLTLWHNIDRRFIAMGAAGWHICLDVLDRFLDGEPIGRRVGFETMKLGGWQRLNAEYAKQFGMEKP